jgi:hypothetical protein
MKKKPTINQSSVAWFSSAAFEKPMPIIERTTVRGGHDYIPPGYL